MTEGIDLLDVAGEGLYFDEACPAEVDALLVHAAGHYGEEAEPYLLRAYFLAPRQLVVLVALYRYYFYQHRLDDALVVAERTLEVTASRLHLVDGWRSMSTVSLGEAVMHSIGLLRFHLLALKGSAVILMRQGQIAEARQRLQKIADIDMRDALGVAPLLATLAARETPATEQLCH